MIDEKNRQDDGWVRCPHCKHKLFMKTGGVDFIPEFSDTPADMQIKCHSCKNIISFVVVKEKKCRLNSYPSKI